MSRRDYVVRISAADGQALGRCRGVSACRASRDAAGILVKTDESEDDAVRLLRSLPGEHFYLCDNGSLVPVGCHLATETLPATDWRSIDDLVDVEFPPARWGRGASESVSLQLVPAHQPVAANGLLTDANSLQQLNEKICPILKLVQDTDA